MIDFCSKCFNDFEAKPHQIKKCEHICPDCRRERERNYRAKRKESGNPVISKKMPREYHAEYESKYKSRPGVRSRKARQAKQYREGPNRHKHEARWKVSRAVKIGQLIKQPCERCGSDKSEAHHEDYSRPLDVMWLCRKHHNEHHAKATGAP